MRVNEELPRGGNGAGKGPDLSQDAWDDVVGAYDRFFGGVFAYCVRRLFSKDAAEDAASAVFVRLVEKFDSLKGKSDIEIRNWLYGTASNVAASLLRDKARQKAVFEAVAREKANGASTPGPSGQSNWPALYSAIAKLKNQQQEILILRFFEGLDTLTIAQIVGIKHVTVRVQLSRAIKRLRRELETSVEELHD